MRGPEPMPSSVPNNSSSTRSGTMAAALSTTKGPSARADFMCMTRAASSLPQPDGPVISTRLLVGATFSIAWRSWLMAVERPIISKL